MRTPLIAPPPKREHWEPKYPFDLVVAYEDLATRNHAMRLHDQLSRQLQDDYDVRCAWWKFHFLTDENLRDQAADDAMAAHMIILSAHARRELPASARAWLEVLSHRPDHHKCALVALLADAGGQPEDTQPLLAYLQRAARQGHMDFFSHAVGVASVGLELSAQQLAERATTVTPTLRGILQQRLPVPHGDLYQP